MFKRKIIIKYAYFLEPVFTAIFIFDANTLLHVFSNSTCSYIFICEGLSLINLWYILEVKFQDIIVKCLFWTNVQPNLTSFKSLIVKYGDGTLVSKKNKNRTKICFGRLKYTLIFLKHLMRDKLTKMAKNYLHHYL